MSKTPLWTIAEVAKALGLSGDFPATEIDFVTQDSRLVKPGSLFVALSGTPSGGFISSFASARDGWEFADKAEAAGAAAMIVPHEIAGKGHETGQIIGDRVLPFSDHEAVAAALTSRVA